VEEGDGTGCLQRSEPVQVCAICCDEAPPQDAIRLGCGHGWYCSACLRKYAEARLESGAYGLQCPEWECAEALAEHEMRQLLPGEVVERFLARSLERAVSAAADLRPCPTPDCAMRVALEEGMSPRLHCELCRKESCLRCGAQPFHSGQSCEEAAAAQRRAGAATERSGASATARSAHIVVHAPPPNGDDGEDGLRHWMRLTGTQQCPTCQIAVTKQHLDGQATQRFECHKMICLNCGTRFCFKCLAVLTGSRRCKCTSDLHGFVDPRTGKRVGHRTSTAKRRGLQPAALVRRSGPGGRLRK